MVWHYIENGKQAGPVDEATFQSMVNSGAINANTQVWRDGMPNWAPYSSLASAGAVATAVAVAPGTAQCAECGNYFAGEDLVQIGDRMVCAACKPIAVQKFKEGVTDARAFHFAGFWIRVAAYIVDYIIMFVVQLVGFANGALADRGSPVPTTQDGRHASSAPSCWMGINLVTAYRLPIPSC